MIPARIGLVTLGVRDLAAAAEFYERLGWPKRGDASAGVVMFDTEGARLALFPLDELGASLPDAPRPEPGAFRGSALVVHVDGRDAVDAACEIARVAGAVIVAEPHETAWGGRVALFADPDGNLFEILGRDGPPVT